MRKLMREHAFNKEMCLPLDKIRLFCELDKTDFVPSKMAEVVKRAEADLGCEVPVCPASLYHRFVEDGNRALYEERYFRRRTMAYDLALAEAYERKGRFTEKLVDVIWAIMEESSWTVPAHLAMYSPSHGEYGLPDVYDERRLHAIDLFSAATASLLSLVYRYNKKELDAYSPVISAKMRYLVRDRQLKPFVNCVFHWMGLLGNTVNNWNPWVISNILYTAATFAEDDYELKLIVGKSAECLDNYTRCLPPDGGCDEGPNYWTVAGAAYFDCLELLYDITGGRFDIYSDPFVKSMCEYEARMYIHGHRFVNFADCTPKVSPDGSQISRMGKKCGSEMLVKFGDSIAAFGDVKVDYNGAYRTVRNLITPEHGSEKSAADVRTWIPNLKIMCARESENTGEGLFVSMKGGHNSEGHNHLDVGSVIVYKNGAPVLIDPGRGEYTKQTFSPRRYELWYMQSVYHNTADFDGINQGIGPSFRSTDEEYDGDKRVKMQLKEAYPADIGIISYTRQTELAGGEVRVTDEFELASEREADIHFMTCEKPRLEDGKIYLPENSVMTFDPSLEASIEEFEVKDRGVESSWGTPLMWRIHLRIKTKKGCFVTVIK